MARISYNKFYRGLDLVSDPSAGSIGFFRQLTNCHLSRSRSIERRKAFVPYGTANISGTYGLGYRQGVYYLFGTVPTPSNLPSLVQYIRYAEPSPGVSMQEIIKTRLVDDGFYTTSRFSDGKVYHHYNGQRVTDWDFISTISTSLNGTANLLTQQINRANTGISAVNLGTVITLSGAPGVAFTVAGSATNGGGNNDQGIETTLVQAASTGTAEVRAVGRFTIVSMTSVSTIDSVTVNSVDVLGSVVPWQGSLPLTLNKVAELINSYTSSPNYFASVAGDSVYIQAAVGSGVAPNGFAVAVNSTGSVSVTTSAMAGGLAGVAGRAQITNCRLVGTFEQGDTYSITLNSRIFSASGQLSGVGEDVLYYKNALYSPVGTTVRKSGLNNFTGWLESNPEAGFFSTENYAETPSLVRAVAKFQGSLAFFSEASIQLWDGDQEIKNLRFLNSLDSEGTQYINSVTPYGDSDVSFLGKQGIRSLRSINERVLPGSDDFGIWIDSGVQESIKQATPLERSNIRSIVDLKDKRLWVFIGKTAWVYTRYNRMDVEGWSKYTLEFSPTGAATGRSPSGLGDCLMLRDESKLYLYGGIDGETYPAQGEAVAVIQPHFTSGDDQSFRLKLSRIDVNVTNEWKLELALNPEDETKKVPISIVHGNGYTQHPLMLPAGMEVNAVAPVLTCSAAGGARCTSVTIYYGQGRENS